jgi:TolB-like protein/Tfp pilus assembly protein PilF
LKTGGGFFAELKRRNVIRMAGLYLVGAWLVTQVASTLFPAFDAPEWTLRTLVIVLAIGFLPALVFAWVFEMTPGGLKRDADVPPGQSIGAQTGRRMEHMIVAVLVLALAYFAFDKFVLAPRRETAIAATATAAATKAQVKASPATTDQSIAVLPLANGGGRDQQFFSDGLSEALIIALSQFDGLQVIGRNSAFQFRDSKDDAATIGRKLGVAHLLEGSVQHAGDVVRISVELINATTGRTLWSQQYDRPYTDLFKLQDEITKAVADALKARLLSTDIAAAQSDRPPSGKVEAYQALLQGNFYANRYTASDVKIAIQHYQQALALDPGYALAYAKVSQMQVALLTSYLPPPPGESRRLALAARQNAERALQLAPQLSQAHLARGALLETLDRDVLNAELEYRQAVALAPQDATAIRRLAGLQRNLGQYDAGTAGLRHATELDPVSSAAWQNLGLGLLASGWDREAETAMRKALDLNPQALGYRGILAIILARQGKSAEAVAMAGQEPDPFWRTWTLATVHELNGERAKSQPYLQLLIARNADDAGFQIAQVYAARKQPDEMFRWLEHARETGDAGILELRNSVFIVDYRNDPRFIAFARKVGVMPVESRPAQADAVAAQ